MRLFRCTSWCLYLHHPTGIRVIPYTTNYHSHVQKWHPSRLTARSNILHQFCRINVDHGFTFYPQNGETSFNGFSHFTLKILYGGVVLHLGSCLAFRWNHTFCEHQRKNQFFPCMPRTALKHPFPCDHSITNFRFFFFFSEGIIH